MSITDPITPLPPPDPGPGAPQTQQEDGLHLAARDLEAAFLSEMLKQARMGEARAAFGGGHGEDHFASLMRSEHARALAAQGGIGLAEAIFRSLVARTEGAR
ncbi:MAG: rod-binding protein [Rhodobacteraceae bacterium]|nr:rod-binding protein [Paracoccaceae bacterium]